MPFSTGKFRETTAIIRFTGSAKKFYVMKMIYWFISLLFIGKKYGTCPNKLM